MTKHKNHFKAFADHTLLKHAILNAYLQRWAFKLLQWGGAGDTVYFVDGFAGAGRDELGNPGSPLIACRIAQQVCEHFAEASRGRGSRLRVIAVEASPEMFKLLETQVEAFDSIDPGCVRLLSGSVSDHILQVTQETKSCPTIYFLDPFGLRGLDAATYPKMLAGPHNEIFALFADIGAARHRGVVHADAPVERQLEALRRSPSLFPELDQQAAQALESAAERKRRVVKQFGAVSREAITRALGDSSWENELRGLSPDAARLELVIRFVRKLVASGAKYVQVLPMHGESGGHKYCLVHASKSLKGYTAMKEAVSESLNRDELSSTMRNRIRDDLSTPTSEIIRSLQERFGGEQVRWTGKNSDAGTMKGFLLEETQMYPFQYAAIKSELAARGWLGKVNRVEVVSVPKR